MIVVDASVLVDAATRTGEAHHRAREVLEAGATVPDVAFGEAWSGMLRRFIRGEISRDGLRFGAAFLRSVPVEVRPTRPLLPRVAQLSEDLRDADAAYVALAEVLGLVLITGDERLAAADGPRCEIRVLG